MNRRCIREADRRPTPILPAIEKRVRVNALVARRGVEAGDKNEQKNARRKQSSYGLHGLLLHKPCRFATATFRGVVIKTIDTLTRRRFAISGNDALTSNLI